MASELSMGGLVERTGVSEGTLRMWERRHGFPVARRLPSGHRRYSPRDVELVRRVAAARAEGIPLAVAIGRAERALEAPAPSLYAALRERHPHLQTRVLTKRLLIALSWAIEYESLSRAERPLLFAAFQRERYFRREEGRWMDLARGAELTVAFADFKRLRVRRGRPAEVPVDLTDPMAREWALVCDAHGHAACVAGWEPPSRDHLPDAERLFETVWSVEPDVVRDAARICAGIVAAHRPALIEPVRARLDSPSTAAPREQLRLAAAVTSRALSNL